MHSLETIQSINASAENDELVRQAEERHRARRWYGAPISSATANKYAEMFRGISAVYLAARIGYDRRGGRCQTRESMDNAHGTWGTWSMLSPPQGTPTFWPGEWRAYANASAERGHYERKRTWEEQDALSIQRKNAPARRGHQ